MDREGQRNYLSSASSSASQGVFLRVGSRMLLQRSRHCLDDLCEGEVRRVRGGGEAREWVFVRL